MASPVPTIIVVALGAGALGGADALRLLLAFAGQGPIVDIGICIFTMGMVTTQILGVVLLVRFVRKARAQAGARAPVADHFAQMTMVVSMGVAVLVCACLLVVSGGLGSVWFLVDFTAKSPVVTVLAVGAMLLASFVSKARTGAGAGRGSQSAPVAHHFAQMTLVVSMGVAVLVSGCLLVVSGGLGSVWLMVDFAAKSLIVTVLAIGAAAAALLPCTTPLLRIFRRAVNADGAAAAAARATERFASMIHTVPLVVVCLLLVIRFVASGGLDAQSLFPSFPWQGPSINMPVGVAIATVAVTTSLVLFFRRARNAASAGGGAATDAGRFSELTEVSCAPPGGESDGGKHACSA